MNAAWLVANPWAGVALVVAALLAMLAALRAARERYRLPAEVLRKLAHVGLGLSALSFPWLFRQAWPVVLLGGLSLATLLAMRYVPRLRAGVGGVVHGVDRASAGDLYFPVAATGLFLLARGDWVLYSLPILTLAFADAVAALIGVYYGRFRFDGAEGKKSLEGSVAFFLVAFLATHIPLLLWTHTGRAESLLIGLTLGLLVMLLEAIAWRGLDNLFIPFGGFLLLRAFLQLDTAALLQRFLVTLALLAVVLLMRRRRTLNDSAVIAGALVAYVAGSVGGWRWLMPPVVLFALYTFLWPRHSHVRDRPHDMVAVFSLTSCSMLWLLLAVVLRRPDLYYPYTLTFAANLSFIGITWWRDYRRSEPAWRSVLTSVVVGWGALLVPYLAVRGATVPALLEVALAFVALLVGAVVFALIMPDTHNRPSREFPWARQAAIGLGASALGLLLTTAALALPHP